MTGKKKAMGKDFLLLKEQEIDWGGQVEEASCLYRLNRLKVLKTLNRSHG
jgi:hypothetical protein